MPVIEPTDIHGWLSAISVCIIPQFPAAVTGMRSDRKENIQFMAKQSTSGRDIKTSSGGCMRIKLLLLVAAVCLSIASSTALAEGNLLQNGGFEEVQDGLPQNWSRDMWLGDTGISHLESSGDGRLGGLCVLVDNTSPNDARFVQTVSVEPLTTYRLSGWVKAGGLNPMEGGAGFSILNTYADFPKVFDTQGEWSFLDCYVTTRQDQHSLAVAARLGFYSHNASGSALFDDVSLTKAGSVPDGITPITLRDDISGLSDKDVDAKEIEGGALIGPVVLGALLAACFLAFGVQKWRRYKKTPYQKRRKSFAQERKPMLSGKTPPLRLSAKDWALMIPLTLIYAAVAFIGLGALKAPQTAYTTTGQTETITFDLGESHTFHILYYGDINQQDHVFSISQSGDGQQWTSPYEVKLSKGDCFKWKNVTGTQVDDEGNALSPSDQPLYMEARYVRFQADGPGLSMMEIVFRDENGQTLPVKSAIATGGREGSASDPRLLTDESETVPEAPGYFNSMYFDEVYHGRTGYEHLHGLKTFEWTHPPLGKVLIMLSIKLFGMTPFGWRFAGALAGVLMVPAMYLMGKLLFQKTRYAFLGAFVMAFDMMHLAQTRIATIDSFAVLFILLAYLCMFRYLQMSFFRDGFHTLLPLGLSGFFMGLACASKWIGLYAGAGLAVLFFWSMAQRFLDFKAGRILLGEHQKQASAYPKYVLGTLAACTVFFIAVPFAIYYFSYIPQFAWEGGLTFERFANMQKSIFHYHATLTETHPYQSPWYEWPLMLRPMWYYSGAYEQAGMVSTIMGMGNPLIWWAGASSLVYVFVRFIKSHLKGGKAADHRPAMLLIAAAAQYVPWMFITRATFIYHYFACLVFVMLCIVYAFEQIIHNRPKAGARLQAVYMVLVLLAFVGFYPFATGVPMTTAWADAMNWLQGLTLPWWNFGGWLRY